MVFFFIQKDNLQSIRLTKALTAKDDSFKNTISILFYDTKLGGKKESKNCTAFLGARYQMIMPEEKSLFYMTKYTGAQLYSFGLSPQTMENR